MKNIKSREYINSFLFWVLPSFSLILIMVLLFLLTYSIDYSRELPDHNLITNFFRGDTDTYRYSLTAAAGSLAATLGIMIAIVILIVQLTANRYTPRVVDLFITHRANLFIMPLFIITITYSLWVSYGINNEFLPRLSGSIAMCLMTVCYAIIVPYFIYLFRLLKPINIINQLSDETISLFSKVIKKEDYKDNDKIAINILIEQINDITSSAVQRMDSEIAHKSISAMQGIMEYYFKNKNHFSSKWYQVDDSYLVGSPRHIIQEMVKNRTWVEFKVFKQFSQIFVISLKGMRDINSSIFQTLRALGFETVDNKDSAVLDLIIKFFNTILRISLESKDMSATNDVLYHYRLLAEKSLEGYCEYSKKISNYFIVYGLIFLEHGLRQNFESVVYDLRKLNEKAVKKNVANSEELLEDFLRFQYMLDYKKHHKTMKCLWKAYAILGSFYMFRGNKEFALKVFEEMKRIPIETIIEIKVEIYKVYESHYWEITDRIINYNFVPENQKNYLSSFFDLFFKDIENKNNG